MTVQNAENPSAVSILRSHWLLFAGITSVCVPTLIHLSQETWSTETGAQGPIVLATGGWLLWSQWARLAAVAEKSSILCTLSILILAIPAYVFGRAFDFLTAEVAGLFLFGIATAQSFFSMRAILQNWFPFFYLALAIPPPAWLLAQVTGPLKNFVSAAAINVLSPFGVPVARQGVTIFVAQYQLLVEDACSGMNSIVGLLAIGLFYIYVARRPSLIYSMILVAFIVPIAVVANIIRIVTLILITYSFGDAVGQGFLHFVAGLFVFVVALLLVFLTDGVLSQVLGQNRKSNA